MTLLVTLIKLWAAKFPPCFWWYTLHLEYTHAYITEALSLFGLCFTVVNLSAPHTNAHYCVSTVSQRVFLHCITADFEPYIKAPTSSHITIVFFTRQHWRKLFLVNIHLYRFYTSEKGIIRVSFRQFGEKLSKVYKVHLHKNFFMWLQNSWNHKRLSKLINIWISFFHICFDLSLFFLNIFSVHTISYFFWCLWKKNLSLVSSKDNVKRKYRHKDWINLQLFIHCLLFFLFFIIL